MAFKRGENVLALVAQIVEKGKQEMKKDDAMLKDAKKSIADVRKFTTSNMANIRRQTENFAAAGTKATNSTLAAKQRALNEELEHRVSEMKDLNDELDEIDNEWNEMKVHTEAIEQGVAEKRKDLEELWRSREAAIKRLELEIEFMRTVTGMYLEGESRDIATFVGHDIKTGASEVRTITYGENSTTDELDNVNKTWGVIESLSGLPK